MKGIIHHSPFTINDSPCDVTGLLIKSMTRIERFPLRRGTATGKRRCSRAQGDVPATYRVEVSKHPGIRTNIPHPRWRSGTPFEGGL